MLPKLSLFLPRRNNSPNFLFFPKMATVAELKKKLEKYKVNTSGLRKAELEELYKNLKSKKDIEYPEPTEVIYHPVDAKVHKDLKKRLKRNGWAVTEVPGWNDEFLEEYIDAIESFCPFRFKEPKTWLSKNLPENLHGIFKYDLGHTPFHWKIRELCIPLFAELYGTDDLLCSFDSLNLSFPRKNDKTESWVHLDQSRANRNAECYQGVVNFLPNGEDDGGLLVVNKSHLIYDEYLENHPKSGYGWFQVNMGDPLFQDLEVLKINLEPGQICFWSSKTAHFNCQPQSESLRMAAYVSMMPRKGCDDATLEKRIKAFEDRRLTNHWAVGKQFSINPKNSRYGSKNPRAPESLNIKKLNKVQRRLVGYEK